MKMVLLVLALLTASCSTARVPTAWRQPHVDKGDQKFVTVGDRRLCVLDRGEGAPVLLLHGLGGSIFDWRHQMDVLNNAGYRVIAVDFLGHGYSETPSDGDYTMRGQAELMVQLLDHLKIRKVSAVGNSYGAGAALFMALDYPDRIERMVLLDAAAIPKDLPGFVAWATMPVLADLGTFLPKSWIVGTVLKLGYYDNDLIEDAAFEEYVYENQFPGSARAKLVTTRSLALRGGDTLLERLHEIPHPTMILWGEHDEIVPYSSGQKIVDRMKQARLVTIVRAGHIPHMERPEEVNRLLLQFLKPRGVVSRSHDRD